MEVVETEVLVVGAGPVGVTLALLLGDLGVSTIVVDKRLTVSQLPRARGLNARGAEILRMVGVERDVLGLALAVRPELQVRQDLAVPPILVQPTGGATFLTVSPCEGIAISQDVLESVLREHLPRRDRVELKVGWQLTSTQNSGQGVQSIVVDEHGARLEIRSQFLVGADGWRSDVRSFLGIQVTGEEDLGRMRSIRFRAAVTDWLGDPPPAMVRLTGVDGILIATHPDGRWVLITPAEGVNEQQPEELVAAALGVDAVVSILDDTNWTAAVQQATHFNQGRGLLVGDAAHRVTPAGATGITSGMADAANVAWKLAATLQGWGGPKLLGSYGQEREPVAAWIGATNLRMWRDTQEGRQTPLELRWLEFGYRYSSPVITPIPGDNDEIDLSSTFIPHAAPGDRAPHAQLSDGRSTIDLAGPQFTLLSVGNKAEWLQAADHLPDSRRPPLALVDDPGSTVREAFGMKPGEAVLIRPDGHIAWRSDITPHPQDQPAALVDALSRATGW